MSWDVMIFSSRQKITSVEDIDEEQFIPIDFKSVLESHYGTIFADGDHREIRGENYAIDYFIDEEPAGMFTLSLNSENASFEVITLAKKQGWQIFDTGNGEITNLDHPDKNGYSGYQAYLQQVLNRGASQT